MSRRDLLIEKLADTMDRDNAVALVNDVLLDEMPQTDAVAALLSIARSACCEPCQEAALVARAALKRQGIRWEHLDATSELLAVLEWAEGQLHALVREDYGNGAFIRGTSIELAGFGAGMTKLRAVIATAATAVTR